LKVGPSPIAMSKGKHKIAVDENCTSIISSLRKAGYSKVYPVPKILKNDPNHDLNLVHRILVDKNITILFTENHDNFNNISKQAYVVVGITPSIKSSPPDLIGTKLDKYLRENFSLLKNLLVRSINMGGVPVNEVISKDEFNRL